MTVLASIPLLTPAAVPLLGERGAVVALVSLAVLGAVIGLVAYLALRCDGREPWRQLRTLGWCLAPMAVLRALATGWPGVESPLVMAATSLLDLMLLVLAGLAAVRLLDARWQRPRRLALLTPMALALFLGVLGGDTTQPLLARNAVAAASHLVAYLLLLAIMLDELVRNLREQRDEAEARASALATAQQSLQAELERSQAEHDEATDRRAQALDLARDAGRRTRLLEHLLAATVELQGRRGALDLFARACELVGQLFGFRRAIVYQWSETLSAFTAQVVLPAASGGEERPAAIPHVDRSEYEQMIHPRFRVSDSYLVPPPSAAWPPRTAADATAWPEGQRLLVPLADTAGVVHGFLSLGEPEADQAPDLLRIRYLELLARQVGTVLAGGETRDQLAACRAELALADERLQAMGELRTNFVANVSHELRTPLTSIIGYAEVLRDRGADMTDTIRREFLDVIHAEGEQLRSIIDNLLDLDRMEEQTARLERVETDLAALTRRLAEDWRQRAAVRGISLDIECAADALVLEADPVLCQQLLGHLVDNAIKFSADDGRVTVRVAEQGTALRLEVQDGGIGIPEDKLHAIFEQFYQVDGSSTREVGGQGVGLSICRDIVSWHDGRIWAENMPVGGARFTVLLPRRPHVVVPEPPLPLNPVFHDARLFIQRLVHWVGENLGVRRAVILTVDPARQHLQVLAATGVAAGELQGLKLARGRGLPGRAWEEGETQLEAPTRADVILSDDGPLLCVPLIDEDEVRGVVAVRERLDGRTFTDDDRALLEAMAPTLVHLLRRLEGQDDLLRDLAAIQSSLRATTRVGSLPHADVAGVCHEICLATARRLGLPDGEVRHLAFALRYYDVGLGNVPPHLLQKTGALTDAERVQLERHVHAGLVALAPLQPPPKVREIILHHHENYDGTGYPKGLSGEAIPLGSRLVSLTDSLRALLQRRPWRPAVPLADALAEIQAFAGTRYCPRLTAVFLEEAARRRKLIEEMRQRADDGEDLKRPAPLHPVQAVRT